MIGSMNRRDRKKSYFYLALLASLAAVICLAMAIYGAIGADQVSIATQVNAVRDYSIFGGSLVVVGMILWVLFFQM
jgi:hypothetical protein